MNKKKNVDNIAGFAGWIKTWGTLLVAAIALVLSGYAIFVDDLHYREVTKPHTQHDQIYDRLAILDKRIERVEQSINATKDYGQDVSAAQKELVRADELRNQAELAWDAGNYAEADKLISEAYLILERIAPSPARPPWWLIGAFITGVIVIGAIIWRILRRRGVLV